MPLAAIFGIGPCGVVSTNFRSFGCASAAGALDDASEVPGAPGVLGIPGVPGVFWGSDEPGITTSWRAPVLPSMMVTVLLFPALAGLSATPGAGGAGSPDGTGMVTGPSGGPSWWPGPDSAGPDGFGATMAGAPCVAGPPMTRGAVGPGGAI